MPKKMFPVVDSVDGQAVQDYTGSEISRIADALERISLLLEHGALACTAEGTNLDNGIWSGISPSNVGEVMTVNEAAEMLRISLPTMYELIRKKRVHSLKIGRKILVSRSSLMNLLQEEN